MIHLRRGYSVLERPESDMKDRWRVEPEPREPASMLKIIFLLLMGSGIPVAIAMAGSALISILWTGNLPPFVVIHRMVSGIDSFPLLAVPFFILAGNLMNNAGITNRIYNYALALVGWLKGGLGHVNVVGSVVFAGMSGTAIADAAGLGTIEIKAMKDHGYSTEFAVGVTAASATLGPIIPPSLPFVIYGMMANVSVGALFLAGILPGLLMAFLMMLTVAYFAHKNGWGADVKFDWPRLIKALAETAVVVGLAPGACGCWSTRAGLPAQLTVFGGLVLLFARRQDLPFPGRAADHDAGAADRRHDHRRLHAHRRRDRGLRLGHGAGLPVYRTLNWKMFVKVCLDTVETTSHGAVHRGRRQHFRLDAHRHRRHRRHRAWVLGFTKEPWVFLLLANLLMLFVGCFLEPTAAITILVPILVPICQNWASTWSTSAW